jgi:hypothetical protein
LVLDIVGAQKKIRRDLTQSPFVWENPVQVDNVFGITTDGPYGTGMLWKVEGFFMINNYHMALINDNDFGLDQV